MSRCLSTLYSVFIIYLVSLKLLLYYRFIIIQNTKKIEKVPMPNLKIIFKKWFNLFSFIIISVKYSYLNMKTLDNYLYSIHINSMYLLYKFDINNY